jgi:hypothetical protein
MRSQPVRLLIRLGKASAPLRCEAIYLFPRVWSLIGGSPTRTEKDTNLLHLVDILIVNLVAFTTCLPACVMARRHWVTSDITNSPTRFRKLSTICESSLSGEHSGDDRVHTGRTSLPNPVGLSCLWVRLHFADCCLPVKPLIPVCCSDLWRDDSRCCRIRSYIQVASSLRQSSNQC